jgi:hypothetical protein
VIGRGHVGGALESLIALTSTLDRGELGPFFYRFRRPGELTARLSLNPS